MLVSFANTDDIPALVRLITSAYRGEASKQGWTTEAYLLRGELRTDEDNVAAIMKNKDAVILKHVTDDGTINGCAYLHQQERGLYLGMLTVSPALQGGGIGKKLLAAADDYARENNCPCIFMNVISLRAELIAWYERHGYYQTAERKPFPNEQRFGMPTQPLEFVIMEKRIDE